MMSVKKGILLTGAGFSQSFGGYLSSQMWAAIFNQPEILRFPRLQRCLLENVDFEAVYDAVLYPGRTGPHFNDAEKAALRDAIFNTYVQMEREIIRSKAEARLACNQFLTPFAGSARDECGFIFTLNQDLLVERYLSFPGSLEALWPHFRLPGVQLPKQIPDDHPIGIILPDRAAVDKIESRFWENKTPCLSYVKLHGSYGWYSRRGEVMVIGNQKSRVLKKEPLLVWYLKLFRQILTSSRNLLVIGYRFRDPSHQPRNRKSNKAGFKALCNFP